MISFKTFALAFIMLLTTIVIPLTFYFIKKRKQCQEKRKTKNEINEYKEPE